MASSARGGAAAAASLSAARSNLGGIALGAHRSLGWRHGGINIGTHRSAMAYRSASAAAAQCAASSPASALSGISIGGGGV